MSSPKIRHRLKLMHVVGMLVSIGVVIYGFLWAIPNLGVYGFVWTGLMLVIAAINLYRLIRAFLNS